MVDHMWLEPRAIRQAVCDDTFFIDVVAVGEDARSLRIRKDIAELLQRPCVLNPAVATVLLAIGDVPLRSDEGFAINVVDGRTQIVGTTTRALVYGFYDWLRRRMLGEPVNHIVSEPAQPIRMIDHWDQTDGSVERGYAGESIFFGRWGSNIHCEIGDFPERDASDVFRGDMRRIEDYARYLASVGINAVCLNNVNVRRFAIRLIVRPWIDRVAQIARIFSEFAIKTYLSVNFAAPKLIGGLDTCDPLDPAVNAWWQTTVDAIYDAIPDFGGFVVKADSEGEPGPYAYGRTHADGANMFARALHPHDGIVIWRAFVYDCHQDWRDRKLDRAKAAYDNFYDLDGQFADNAILQIKFGPIDFQPSEPLNPLIGAMKRTNLMIEFQIAAEYLGHQIDVNYMLPQWLAAIRTDTGAGDNGVLDTGQYLQQAAVNPALVGYAAVANVGMDDNWTGHKLAQANLYGYGRMCWDQSLSAQTIAREWVLLTFADADTDVQQTITWILDTSNDTYESYAAPLGVGFMVRREDHYGVGINDFEYDRWGTYHYADRDGVGVDRTVATGTGYIGQYAPAIAATLENVDTCPDQMLLFFHHVPYSHVLHDGTSVIQHIYDTHFAGVDMVDEYIRRWATLQDRIGDESFANVAERLQRQRRNAIEWRDQINTYFYRMSGIADSQGRLIYR